MGSKKWGSKMQRNILSVIFSHKIQNLGKPLKKSYSCFQSGGVVFKMFLGYYS